MKRTFIKLNFYSFIHVFLFALVPLLISNKAFSQSENDSIIIKKADPGRRYYFKGEELSFDRMYEITESNEKAFHFMNQANGTRLFTRIALGTGIGVIITAVINGKNKGGVSEAWLGVGFGICASSIIGIIETGKNKRKAANAYNENLASHSIKEREINLSFGQTFNGFGFVLEF